MLYDKTPIFIPINILEDEVKLVERRISGSSGTEGTDSKDLQIWLLKFGEEIKRLCISVETLIDWLANKNST